MLFFFHSVSFVLCYSLIQQTIELVLNVIIKETKSATMNIFRKKYFLFK